MLRTDFISQFFRKLEDARTRRDRTEARNLAFQGQMPWMVSAYIRYCAEQEMPTRPRDTPQAGPPMVDEVYEITVVHMFGAGFFFFSCTDFALRALCTACRFRKAQHVPATTQFVTQVCVACWRRRECFNYSQYGLDNPRRTYDVYVVLAAFAIYFPWLDLSRALSGCEELARSCKSRCVCCASAGK